MISAEFNGTHQVRRALLAFIVAAATLLLGQQTSAQGLTFSVFERYLESLREQAGIPGMSAIVLQQGVPIWESGFGRADLEAALPATPATPYAIGGLSQTVGATMLLKECVDESFATLNDPVADWVPAFPERDTTLAHLLGHVAPTGAFAFDLTRFAALTPVVEECAGAPYRELLGNDIFDLLQMWDSVPGSALAAPTAVDSVLFEPATLRRYARVLGSVAKPYRVENGRPVRTDLPPAAVNAATGIITTVRDLARFDVSFRYNLLLRPDTTARAWTPVAPNFPAGLGWFVQTYNGEPIVWQFGELRNAYSALIVKAPNRGLSFIILANSDALAAPFARGETWDVTASLFARLFLRVFLP
jgi:CubicO group peptidase (beta-lactamase class C family)